MPWTVWSEPEGLFSATATRAGRRDIFPSPARCAPSASNLVPPRVNQQEMRYLRQTRRPSQGQGLTLADAVAYVTRDRGPPACPIRRPMRAHVHLPADRRHPPDQYLLQARRLLPARTCGPRRPPRRSRSRQAGGRAIVHWSEVQLRRRGQDPKLERHRPGGCARHRVVPNTIATGQLVRVAVRRLGQRERLTTTRSPICLSRYFADFFGLIAAARRVRGRSGRPTLRVARQWLGRRAGAAG